MKVTAYCTFENEALALVTMTTGFLLEHSSYNGLPT